MFTGPSCPLRHVRGSCGMHQSSLMSHEHITPSGDKMVAAKVQVLVDELVLPGVDGGNGESNEQSCKHPFNYNHSRPQSYW